MPLRSIVTTRGALLAAGLILFLSGCSGGGSQPVQAVGGRLDLRSESFDAPVALKGEWLARAGVDSAVFSSYGYDDRSWRPVEVESYFREQGFPDEGLVWYRLHLRLPPGAPPLKGFLQHADNAHAIYVAGPGEPGRKVAESGHPALSRRETVLSRKPVVFLLPPDTSLVISWVVANHDYLNGGPFYAIEIGAASDIDRMVLLKTAVSFLCYGLYILIAACFLLYWAMHRSDLRSLAVGLLAFDMAVRSVSVSGSLELLFPEHVGFALRILIDGATYLALNGLLAFLLWVYFPLEFAPRLLGFIRLQPPPRDLPAGISATRAGELPGWVCQFNTWAVGLAIVSSAAFVGIALGGSPLITSHVLAVDRWISLVLVLPMLIVTGSALYHRRPLAWSMVWGTGLIVLGGVHDVLLARGMFKGHPYVATYMFVGFVLVQSYALVRRNLFNALLVRRSEHDLRAQVEFQTRELRAATEAAQEANAAKSQFVSAVSHELRTPLASILGYSELLTEDMREGLTPQQLEFCQTIHLSAQRLLLLVNDLLDVAKIEAGQLTLHVDTVDLRSIIQEAVDLTYPLANEKNLYLKKEVRDEAPLVRADWMRLRQVILNLLSNAVKFTDAGGVTIRIDAVELDGAPALAIAVEDTGPGISSEFMPHLFERFSQDRDAHTRTQRGTGLGLTISREFTERMGGRIFVESVEGQGSTFTVVLPRAPVSTGDEADVYSSSHSATRV
ncbi:MAG TPA: ATP-binding protein [Rhodothermales bacterium]|nr:ATP-binding protein [Rhodothermales bacterium]